MPTIKDVAKRAGVSAMTVSRVLNDASNVGPATRQKVQKAVDELGYVRSGAAKSLRSKRSHTLALVVPDNANVFWTTVARGVEDAARPQGYSVLLCNTDENVAKQQRYLDVIAGQQVDGVIIAPCDSDAHNLARLRSRQIPTVVVDRTIEGWEVDTVIGDSVSGAWALTRHLIDLGHRRIAILSGPRTTSTALDRVLGYRYALAEAGLIHDPRLVKEGEYRAISGERLTHQLLEEGGAPTAIFAANNALMLGALDALAKKGLRVPQDIALVSFGDLPKTSRLFPFLTVADLPNYEMGVNAAQLLLSRLDAEVSLKPRYVVLPARLIIRQSCGNKLQEDGAGGTCLSLPVPREPESQSLVEMLAPDVVRDLAGRLSGIPVRLPPDARQLPSTDAPDVDRLLAVLQHQEADRVPYLELKGASQAAYEYVLQRELEGDPGPVDRVEFARRLGMDAIVCTLSWQPDEGARPDQVETWSDLARIEPAPSLAGQLGTLEHYLRAVQGTGVGVIAGIPSFFPAAMQRMAAKDLGSPGEEQVLVEAVLDLLLDHGEVMMRAVCDRFAQELAFVLVNDDLRGAPADLDLFTSIYAGRMARLIAPAKEHGKLVALHTKGRVAPLLRLLHSVGFDAIHPVQPEANDLRAIRQEWAGRLALFGGFPGELLEKGDPEENREVVRAYCVELAPGGGYVLGSSSGITAGVRPENLMAVARAVQQYGRYGSLGELAPI